MRAIIFDLDGTIAETEENHRKAFNRAFAEAGLAWNWEQKIYKELLRIAGGKERISHYIKEYQPSFPLELAEALHRAKDSFYQQDLTSIKLRPGIREIFLAAQNDGVILAIATTTRRANLLALFKALEIDPTIFAIIACGEDCWAKKPAPDIYLKVLAELNLPSWAALAIEDSPIGLKASNAANIPTLVTPSFYTEGEDFTTALAVLPDLAQIDLEYLKTLHGDKV